MTPAEVRLSARDQAAILQRALSERFKDVAERVDPCIDVRTESKDHSADHQLRERQLLFDQASETRSVFARDVEDRAQLARAPSRDFADRWAYLRHVLDKYHGRIDRCAAHCGLSRRSISEKLRRYRIDKADFKPRGARRQRLASAESGNPAFSG